MAKAKQYWSVVGTARYPKISEPDIHPEYAPAPGVYKCDIVVPADKAAPMVAFLDKAAAEGAAAGKPKRGTEPSVAYEELDDGTVLFKYKTKAGGVSQKTGKPWSKEVLVVDASNLPVTGDDRSFWTGSKVKVLFTAEPFFKSSLVYGVSVRLEAVKLIDPVYGSGPDLTGAADFGGDDEDLSSAPKDFDDESDPDPSDLF